MYFLYVYGYESLNPVEVISGKCGGGAGCPWLTPVVLATQEVEIRRIEVRSQPGQIVSEILSLKHPS
jgi:hypothetical protein